jgi:hypothetical protein
VAHDVALAFCNFLERADAPFHEVTHPRTRSHNRGEQCVTVRRIKVFSNRGGPSDTLFEPSLRSGSMRY